MNVYLACTTVAESPMHAIITAESVVTLAAVIFSFLAYARHRDQANRPNRVQVIAASLAGWVALSIWVGLCVAIPIAVHAIAGTGLPTWSICAPAPILQCAAWISCVVLGVAWIVSRDTFAHLRERRAAGKPAFVRTVPTARPYQAGRIAPESSPAPYALRELLRLKPSASAAVPAVKKSSLSGFLAESEAAAQAALWARVGTVGRFTDSPRGRS